MESKEVASEVAKTIIRTWVIKNYFNESPEYLQDKIDFLTDVISNDPNSFIKIIDGAYDAYNVAIDALSND